MIRLENAPNPSEIGFESCRFGYTNATAPQYLALFRTIGPFFIMVIEMVRRDVTKFMMLLMVVIPGFTLATSVVRGEVLKTAISLRLCPFPPVNWIFSPGTLGRKVLKIAIWL